jgi:hypothetical protein
LVITRFGGYDSLDVDWVQEKLASLSAEQNGWFLVRLNTKPFTHHSRAIFIPMAPDPVENSRLAATGMCSLRRGEWVRLSASQSLKLFNSVTLFLHGKEATTETKSRRSTGLTGPSNIPDSWSADSKSWHLGLMYLSFKHFEHEAMNSDQSALRPN